jgi:hypothetical protein
MAAFWTQVTGFPEDKRARTGPSPAPKSGRRLQFLLNWFGTLAKLILSYSPRFSRSSSGSDTARPHSNYSPLDPWRD